METWLPVVGYEKLYQVSDLGRAWSEPRWSGGSSQGRRFREGRYLAKLYSPKGYPKYSILSEGVTYQVAAHTLVLTAFVGPCPPGMECCHEDGDPANCSLPNLRWDTHSSNLRDKVRHGTDFQSNKLCCPRKHLYVPENLRRGTPHRQCQACTKAHNRLCRYIACDHWSSEFIAAADWYYTNPGVRWRVST